MGESEVVLMPEVFDVGGVEAGGQALERLVIHARHVNAIGGGGVIGVLGTELGQALLGTWRHAVEAAGLDRDVVELFAQNAHTFKARRKCAVANVGQHRGVHRLTAGGQGRVGNARLDVGQAHLAPLPDRVAVVLGQRTVGAAHQVVFVTVQRNGVVYRHLRGKTDSALGEARAVVNDGALNPVDPARVAVDHNAVLFAGELAATAQQFVGVPVLGRTGQLRVLQKALGFALEVAGGQCGRNEFLTGRLCLGRDADGEYG